MAKVIEATHALPHPRAQQDTGRTALREFKSFFPDNAVEYFVSYYDYQPEAYVPRAKPPREGCRSTSRSIVALGNATLLESD
jgi:excinuclease ABC subunit B